MQLAAVKLAQHFSRRLPQLVDLLMGPQLDPSDALALRGGFGQALAAGLTGERGRASATASQPARTHALPATCYWVRQLDYTLCFGLHVVTHP